MFMKAILSSSAAIALSVGAAAAAPITFTSGGLVGNSVSASQTVDGLTLTMTAGSFVDGFNFPSSSVQQDNDGNNVSGYVVGNNNTYAADPRLNRTGSGIGVNNQAGTDDSNTVDGSNWDDFLQLAFSKNVQMVSVEFGSFNAGFPGYDDFRIMYDLSGNGALGAGDFVTFSEDDNPFSSFPVVSDDVFGFLATGANDDWRWKSITVEVSAVPLPASSLMLLAGVGGLAAMRRRQKKNKS
jgi:PEP-CTERM motif-containing protein